MLKNTKDTDTNQRARFLETARALGCDEDEAAFDKKLRGIVKPSPIKLLKPTEDS